MARRLKAAVAGAGLGGLFAAAALARAGLDVTVCEAAPSLGEVGAGIQISPNGARLLARAGALEAVARRAVAPEAAAMRRGEDGGLIFSLPLGAAAERRWGAPYLQVHRADLLAALRDAAEAAGARLRLGARAVGATDGALLLEEGAEEADVVIAADGVRSTLRAALFGPVAPRFLGHVAWRATVPAEAAPGWAKPEATVWAGAGRHLVTYPLRGGALVNVVAVVERDAWDGEGRTAESWSAAGDPEEMRAAFAGWAAAPLLAAVERCFLWGLFDRPPPPSWSRGRTALLGDACHPMLPFMAQGAVQAIEDGAALARLLRGAGVEGVEAALAAYEAARRGRAEAVQARARANAGLFHQPPGPARALRRGVLGLGARLAPSVAMGRLDWLYGHVEPA